MANEVATLEARPNLVAGGKAMAIVPQTMDEAYRLAKAVCLANMAPKGLDKPEACMIAIMHGLEVGLTPMAALQRIAVVNGRPTIWGDGAMGLVRGSGACEYVRERIEGQGDQRRAICEAKRKGEPEPIARSFSVADAKRAGLWDKAGPWKQFPDRMLQMRARAFALRDGFADVLGGLYLREEIEDEGARQNTPTRAPSPPSPPPAAEEPGEDPEAEPPLFVELARSDPEAFLKRLDRELSGVSEPDQLPAMWDILCPDEVRDLLIPPDQDEALGIYRRHERRLEP